MDMTMSYISNDLRAPAHGILRIYMPGGMCWIGDKPMDGLTFAGVPWPTANKLVQSVQKDGDDQIVVPVTAPRDVPSFMNPGTFAPGHTERFYGVMRLVSGRYGGFYGEANRASRDRTTVEGVVERLNAMGHSRQLWAVLTAQVENVGIRFR